MKIFQIHTYYLPACNPRCSALHVINYQFYPTQPEPCFGLYLTFSYSSSNPSANISIFTPKIYSESASFLLSLLYLPDPSLLMFRFFCLLMFRFLQETSKHSLYFYLGFIQHIDIRAILQTSESGQMIPLFKSHLCLRILLRVKSR